MGVGVGGGRQYNKLSETDRARALGCLDAGIGSREVARKFQTSHQTINRIRQRYRHTELFKDRPRSGRPKITTAAEDRYVTNVIARNRFVTGPDLVADFMLLGSGSPACISSDRAESHSCRWFQVKSACKEARTQAAPKECSYGFQPLPM